MEFTEDTLYRVFHAHQAQEARARAHAVEDARHGYSARMEVPDALTWCVDRADEHGYRGELRKVFTDTFVDFFAGSIVTEVGLDKEGAGTSDDMTCARCGGHFERWEGIDNPEPTCPWCLVESRFNA